MAATAVSTVLSKFGELALSEGQLLVQVGDKMVLLRDRLEWLQAFIHDADRKRRTGTDGLSRVWLRQTRDVAFQAEDALDEFFHQVDLESQGYEGWKKWGKYVIGFWTQITVQQVLSGRLDQIHGRLAQISDNQKEYNIQHTPLVSLSSSTTASAAWWDERNDIVGFDDDINQLENLLLREDRPETMFISIIGESGVGKSTLALALINRLTGVDREGETKCLTFIPPDSWPEEAVRELYLAYSKKLDDSDNAGEDTDPAVMLHVYFSKLKYMLIIDGITSITMLNLLRRCLPDNNKGSSVVLVLDAENEEVALHANRLNPDGIYRIHFVPRLDEKRSGELFVSKAMRKEVSSEEKKKYDQKVFAITRGHPLSIVLLSGLLRFKEEPLQWELVLQELVPGEAMEAKVAEFAGDRKTSPCISTAMERIFWASFEDLHNDIKSCFLYFATAPKNAAVYAEGMVWMWIGEGFIKPHKGRTMEEVGHRYMKELALRCLIQVLSRNELNGEIETVKVHSSLHGFLQSEAREAGFVEVHDIHDVFVPPSARRLSFQMYGGRYSAFTNKLPKLRSFISMGSVSTSEMRFDSTGAEKEVYDLKFLLGSKFLRVLVVSGKRVNELPEDIGKLLELRYIGVGSKDLKVLPSSMKWLLKLQTLNIMGTDVHTIHPGFWKIKTLRHVIATNL